jgi:hypothetical protein
MSAGPLEQVNRLLLIQAHAGAFHNLKAGPMDFLTLFVRQSPKLGAEERSVVGSDVCHVFTPLLIDSVDPILLGLDPFGQAQDKRQIQAQGGDLAIPSEQSWIH